MLFSVLAVLFHFFAWFYLHNWVRTNPRDSIHLKKKTNTTWAWSPVSCWVFYAHKIIMRYKIFIKKRLMCSNRLGCHQICAIMWRKHRGVWRPTQAAKASLCLHFVTLYEQHCKCEEFRSKYFTSEDFAVLSHLCSSLFFWGWVGGILLTIIVMASCLILGLEKTNYFPP